MNETPSTFPRAGLPTCSACGQRPGTVRMVFANGMGGTILTSADLSGPGSVANTMIVASTTALNVRSGNSASSSMATCMS